MKNIIQTAPLLSYFVLYYCPGAYIKLFYILPLYWHLYFKWYFQYLPPERHILLRWYFQYLLHICKDHRELNFRFFLHKWKSFKLFGFLRLILIGHLMLSSLQESNLLHISKDHMVCTFSIFLSVYINTRKLTFKYLPFRN